MKPWKIVLIPTVITLLIAAIYIWHISNKRKNPGVVKQGEEQPLTQDDVAVVRMEFPAHFEDVKDLAGKSVWMKNGYTMPYYAYAGGRVDFKKKGRRGAAAGKAGRKEGSGSGRAEGCG